MDVDSTPVMLAGMRQLPSVSEQKPAVTTRAAMAAPVPPLDPGRQQPPITQISPVNHMNLLWAVCRRGHTGVPDAVS